MSWLHSQMALLSVSTTIVELALNWLLQSTLLSGLGLLGGRLLQRRGSAVQSVVYRTTLAAVLLCPIASAGLWLAGVSGWSVALPEPWTVAAVTVDATPTAPPTPRQLEPLETLEANRFVPPPLIDATTETDSLSTQPLPPQQFPPQETAGPIAEETLPAATLAEPTPVAVIPPTESPVAALCAYLRLDCAGHLHDLAGALRCLDRTIGDRLVAVVPLVSPRGACRGHNATDVPRAVVVAGSACAASASHTLPAEPLPGRNTPCGDLAPR